MTTIQLRRGTAAQWTTANPVLAVGEEGLETDTGRRKVGDGAANWAARPYDGVQPRVELLRDTDGRLALTLVQAIANPVNNLSIASAGAGIAPTLGAAGADPNIGINYQTKGTGGHVFRDGASAPALLLAPAASATNYFVIRSAATGGSTVIEPNGSDTVINATIRSKGTTSGVVLSSGGGWSLVAVAPASSANYVQTSGAIAGSAPTIAAAGETNLDLNVRGAGIGRVNVTNLTASAAVLTGPQTNALYSSATGAVSLGILAPASAVNYLSVRSTVAGGVPQFEVAGPDSNIGLMLVPKAAGNVLIYAGTGQTPTIQAVGADAAHQLHLQSKGLAGILLKDGAGQGVLIAQPVANAVNYLEVRSGATGASVVVMARGTDADVHLNLRSQGVGSVYLVDGASLPIARFAPVASSVNYFQFANSATLGALQFSTVGADANVGLIISSKGNGSNILGSNNGWALRGRVSSASSVNFISIDGTLTGVPPQITADGPAASIDLALQGKGADGRVVFYTIIKHRTYATAGRPAAATAGAGAEYFDITLNKPVYSDGTAWRDAMANVV